MANEKMKVPEHCGKEMGYVRFSAIVKSEHMIETNLFYKCQQQGCKHEEIITTTRSDYNPNWIGDLGKIVENGWKALDAGSETRPAREQALFETLREREDSIKAIMDRHREREKMGFWAHLFASD